jgi:hypothetical protein
LKRRSAQLGPAVEVQFPCVSIDSHGAEVRRQSLLLDGDSLAGTIQLNGHFEQD